MAAPWFDRSSAHDLGEIRVPVVVPIDEPRTLSDGVVLELAAPMRLPAGAAEAGAGLPGLVVRIRIPSATAARLRFSGVPAGSVLWVAGSGDQEFLRFEPAAGKWGPATQGSEVFVAGESMDGLVVDAVALIGMSAAVAKSATNAASCLEDVACPLARASFDELSNAVRAVAYLRIVRDGKSFVCTGALVNDAAGSRTPYLLTARHCVPNAAAAASIEVIWDLRSSACGSNQMERYQRSYGAELLVASAETDVALLKLNTPAPAGRVYLGIDTRRLSQGSVVRHVSHAYGLSQTFASSVVTESGLTCGGAPRPQFIYSEPKAGAVASGSSGAPMLVNGLYVAGQLLGLCGADPANPCATFNDIADGSIRASWSLLAPHLAPARTQLRSRSIRH